MPCNEHELSATMYCQKCDTFVCDTCHMIDNSDHYHYLFLERPRASDVQVTEEKVMPSSSEIIKSIEEKNEEKIRQAIAITNRNMGLKDDEKKK